MNAEEQRHMEHAATGLVLSMAIKALVATHPNPAQVRMVFEQLMGQSLASPAVLDESNIAAKMRVAAGLLFDGLTPPEGL